MKKMLLVFFFSAYMISPAQQWEIVGEMNNPVAGAETAVFDSLVYIIGGYSDDLQLNVDWIQKYNPEVNRFTLAGSLLMPRFGFAGAQNDTAFYFTGGTETPDTNFIDYWEVNKRYSSNMIHIQQFDRSYPSAEIIDDKFYLIGGSNNSDSTGSGNYIIEFDLQDSAITNEFVSIYEKESFPGQQMTFKYYDDIYIIGGARNGILKDIFVFNTKDTSYTKLDIELPAPIAGGQVIYDEVYSEAYIIGGYNESTAALGNVYKMYAGAFPYIMEMQGLNYPRAHFQAVLFDRKIYVFGGFDEEGNVVKQVEMLDLEGATTEVKSENPNRFELHQNYPNPFNPGTNISFSLAEKSKVEISVYTLLGEKVETAANGFYSAGNHNIYFDADERNLSSGIYFYQLKTDNLTQTRKMVYLK